MLPCNKYYPRWKIITCAMQPEPTGFLCTFTRTFLQFLPKALVNLCSVEDQECVLVALWSRQKRSQNSAEKRSRLVEAHWPVRECMIIHHVHLQVHVGMLQIIKFLHMQMYLGNCSFIKLKVFLVLNFVHTYTYSKMQKTSWKSSPLIH